MNERNYIFTAHPPPISVHEMDMDKYTVAENCHHLRAELKAYAHSFQSSKRSLTHTSSETIFVACGETKTILHLNIVMLIRKCARKSL